MPYRKSIAVISFLLALVCPLSFVGEAAYGQESAKTRNILFYYKLHFKEIYFPIFNLERTDGAGKFENVAKFKFYLSGGEPKINDKDNHESFKKSLLQVNDLSVESSTVQKFQESIGMGQKGSAQPGGVWGSATWRKFIDYLDDIDQEVLDIDGHKVAIINIARIPGFSQDLVEGVLNDQYESNELPIEDIVQSLPENWKQNLAIAVSTSSPTTDDASDKSQTAVKQPASTAVDQEMRNGDADLLKEHEESKKKIRLLEEQNKGLTEKLALIEKDNESLKTRILQSEQEASRNRSESEKNIQALEDQIKRLSEDNEKLKSNASVGELTVSNSKELLENLRAVQAEIDPLDKEKIAAIKTSLGQLSKTLKLDNIDDVKGAFEKVNGELGNIKESLKKPDWTQIGIICVIVAIIALLAALFGAFAATKMKSKSRRKAPDDLEPEEAAEAEANAKDVFSKINERLDSLGEKIDNNMQEELKLFYRNQSPEDLPEGFLDILIEGSRILTDQKDSLERLKDSLNELKEENGRIPDELARLFEPFYIGEDKQAHKVDLILDKLDNIKRSVSSLSIAKISGARQKEDVPKVTEKEKNTPAEPPHSKTKTAAGKPEKKSGHESSSYRDLFNS